MLLRNTPRRRTPAPGEVETPNTIAAPVHAPAPPASIVLEWTSTSLPSPVTWMWKPHAVALVMLLLHAAPRTTLFSIRAVAFSANTPVTRVAQPPVMVLRSTSGPEPFTSTPMTSIPRLPVMVLPETRRQPPPSHAMPIDWVGLPLVAPWMSLLPITVQALPMPPEAPHATPTAREAAPWPPPASRTFASITGRQAPTERIAETSASEPPSAAMTSLSTIQGALSEQPSSRMPWDWSPPPWMRIELPRTTVPVAWPSRRTPARSSPIPPQIALRSTMAPGESLRSTTVLVSGVLPLLVVRPRSPRPVQLLVAQRPVVGSIVLQLSRRMGCDAADRTAIASVVPPPAATIERVISAC